jgi:AraC-like DNA-binding protein
MSLEGQDVMTQQQRQPRTRGRRRSTRSSLVRMAPTMTVPSLLRELGVEPAGLLAEFGLVPGHFDEPDRLLSFESRSALLARCAQAARCPHFGLLVGQRGTTSVLGPVGFLMQSAPTLRAALAIGIRQLRLHNPVGSLAYSRSGAFCTFSFTILGTGHVGDEQSLDMAIAGMFNVMRTLCGNHWQPVEARIAHSRPRNVSPYRRFLQAPVVFDSDETSLVFRSEWLGRPVATADPLLHLIMQQYVREMDVDPGEDLSGQLRRLMPALLAQGDAKPMRAARRLGLGVRTLNRRLAEEGSAFALLRDESRHAMAGQLLGNTRMSAGQVATRLGYANASAFTRAFLRWTGMSPMHWRAAQDRPR